MGFELLNRLIFWLNFVEEPLNGGRADALISRDIAPRNASFSLSKHAITIKLDTVPCVPKSWHCE